MTRLPRGLSGSDLVAALAAFGYQVSRQTGSHVRLTTQQNGEHHVSAPLHDNLRVGTLAGILADVAHHAGRSRDEVLAQLFGTP